AKTIAEFHHEKMDGTGYPHGIKGEEIPIEARIASICDVFDALISDRPYKAAWSNEKALAYIIEHSGTHFDTELVNAFMKIYPQIIEYTADHTS
ncbi:MAG: HD domain-containing phosphohydrolase, partial [Pseudomonadota bacterium]|nr:HD domain-containing phosphohydrolase [Pseudomonadota bacterium]